MQFSQPFQNSESLGTSITSVASSLKGKRTVMTELGGKALRTVKNVRREKHGAVDAEYFDASKWWRCPLQGGFKWRWNVETIKYARNDRKQQEAGQDDDKGCLYAVVQSTCGVEARKHFKLLEAFGIGGAAGCAAISVL